MKSRNSQAPLSDKVFVSFLSLPSFWIRKILLNSLVKFSSVKFSLVKLSLVQKKNKVLGFDVRIWCKAAKGTTRY